MDKPILAEEAFRVAKVQPESPQKRRSYPRAVRLWLIAGLVLIFVQVVVGGITRLTGSGLSITKWEIVTGTLPPLNETDWLSEFDLYKATPQYEKMNEGMSLGDFKFIYFWEYFHRLWARMMGFAFIIPLAFFLFKGYIDRALGKRLGLVFFSAALTASFGWIMVASGLIDRPLVNAYKLSMHLGIAFTTFGILLWTTLWTFNISLSAKPSSRIRKLVYWTAGVLIVQVLLGGMMSGMKAALFYPTWPDLNSETIPAVLTDTGNWTFQNFVEYDKHPFMAALVQLFHRTTGYIVALLISLLLFVGLGVHKPSARAQNPSNGRWAIALWITFSLMVLQVVLGIGTLLMSSGGIIPVSWGVLHQAVALLLLSAVLYNVWLVRSPSDL